MYSCYESLDTNNGQNYRQPLYQDIVDYLNAKILSTEFDNNIEFMDNAYQIILMAESIIDLNSAAGGYEFLAFNHPDPDIRLAASWNYAEIEELLNLGNGGGTQFQISNDKLQMEKLWELKELQRLHEIIANDPVMSKMKKSFEKTSNSKKDSFEKQLDEDKISGDRSENSKPLQMQVKESELDKIKFDKAKRNIYDAKTLNKKDRERRMMEDFAITTLEARNEKLNIANLQIPLQYTLGQNYPNPFNPTTNLEYAISELGFVSLKIYDMLGKEVKILVNETKTAGKYTVSFDGSNLPSGIYFYKIKAGDFNQVKRMTLLK
jgi:hypothetical protein